MFLLQEATASAQSPSLGFVLLFGAGAGVYSAMALFDGAILARLAGDGTQLSYQDPTEPGLSPDRWPADQSWCRVKWESIERHYGPATTPRQAAASRRS